MAKVVAWNDATIGAKALTDADIVSHSVELSIKGDDQKVVLSDGRIKWVRNSIKHDGRLQLYGQWAMDRDGDTTARDHNLNSAAGVSVDQIIPTTSGITFKGLATATHDKAQDTTTVEVKGDPLQTTAN